MTRLRRAGLFVLFLILPFPAAGSGMTFGGRFGLEVDGLGEEYSGYGVIDDRIDLDDSIEEQIEQPVRSRDTRTLALLQLSLGTTGDRKTWFQLQEIGRVGSGRQRNSLITEVGFRGSRDRFRLENQWHIQGGEDEPTGGVQDFLTVTWDRMALPFGLRSQVRFGADWSRAAQDTLAPIFDYRSLRGQLQLRRDLTALFELRALFGVRQKEAFRSSFGSYDSWYAEGEAGGFLHERGQFDLILRAEERSYEEMGGIPSSREIAAENRYEYRAGRILRPYSHQRFEWQDYENPTDVFQDHWSWTGEFGSDLLWLGSSSDEALLGFIDNERARFRVGGRIEFFRASSSASDSLSFRSTYDSFGGIVGVAREGIESFWVDVSLEAGYRDYLAAADTRDLAFDGLNFSFSMSDYAYIRATVLMEWKPVSWLRAEAFVQWDEELHRRSSDDFRLWILNASLAYPF